MNRAWVDAQRHILGRSYIKNYSIINRIDTTEELAAFQSKQLTKFLLHCNDHVPHYRSLFERVDLVKDREVDLYKFSALPLLNKEIIREDLKNLTSDDYKTRRWYYNTSGGSTGEPLQFIQDTIYRSWGNAANYYYYKNILDIDVISARKVVLWGTVRDIYENTAGLRAKIHDRLSSTTFLNSFVMTEDNLEHYVNVINTHKPAILRGYAGSLYELSRYIEKKKKSVFTPTVIVSAAETLRREMKEKIENVFGAKVYNFYGSREVNNLAGECKAGLMHVFTFANNVELLNDQKSQVQNHGHGKVVVTSLFNYSMPFVRYEIGDFAVLGTKKCRCGNVLPTFEQVSGRVIEHFLKEDGTIVPGEFFVHLIGVVCNKDAIKKFQVIQEDYKKIRILVVPQKDLTGSFTRAVESEIHKVMGDCEIIWDIIDDIPQPKSGKFLYTRSLVKDS